MTPFSSPAQESSRRDRRIAQAAADWLALSDRGLSRAEREELRRWLEADERHAQLFAQMRETWSLLDEAGTAQAAADFDPEVDVRSPRRHAMLRWLPVPLAAAAALTFALIGGWQVSRPPPDFSATATTAIGRVEIMNLPDGSVVQLNTDSAVVVRYGNSDRRIRLLRGEAHFVVARDAVRPFTVVADRVAVRAVGTAFNVKLRSADVEVLVTEGRVRVNADAAALSTELSAPPPAHVPPPALLAAGEKVTIPLAAPVVAAVAPAPVVIAAVSAEQIETTLAWRRPKIDFVATPLSEIVAEFNRFNRIKLVIADSALASRRFGGSFRIDDPDTLVHLLETTFDVVADRQGGVVTLRPNR